MNTAGSLFDQVQDYVRNTSELAPYEDIILYDWPEGDEHLTWVLAAGVDEVVDWASRIQADERSQEINA